ncbi:hypothetical protein SERLA73DRAFT_188059 [Serpula lacrymans var. lacrymans S7.3]|uniref:Uncharacterized protein n=2 Tax=Serpula lacrymans var. lacrymans TaxID=341189 RepID=F8QBQ9_SERL3|nr:uncharacterized protein SERLADRAFT_478024 [Serpula lacrymans var. lacrymans S7.9]EGN94270.1 hypothetical protein SERLA73DRAFT_188059 [Serpula lacrymans var. lacrymans S7.3]EGO19760.1 hypothetical protein SERLADRAFT_478024 [Serpula lacrymans var. lacrymans S7.9]
MLDMRNVGAYYFPELLTDLPDLKNPHHCRLKMGASQSFPILPHHPYLALIRPRMSFPTDIFGLFQPATFGPATPDIWERLLRVDDTSQCYIDRVLFLQETRVLVDLRPSSDRHCESIVGC